MSLYEGSACDMISEGVELKKTQEIILIGAGGHSMPVVDTVSMISQLWNYMNLRIPRQQIIGFIDTEKTGEWLGYPILGREIEDIPDYQEYWYHVSIGSIKAREKYYKSIKSLGLRFATIISPGAAISHSSIIGDGTFIGMNCYVGAHVEIGENCLINTGAVLEHCTIVGKNCNISTNATLNPEVPKFYIYVGAFTPM